MKDNYTTSRKHKRARSLSNSSHFTISDDDNPKQNNKEGKNLEDRYKHRKHYKHGHKHHRQQNSDSSENEEVNTKYKISEKRHKDNDLVPEVRVKEEPQSEDERDRKYKNRHSDQSRMNDDLSRRNESRHHREDSRRRANNSEPRANDRSRRRPVREEVLNNDVEPEWGKKEVKKEKKEPAKNNAKPDFGLSGKLTEDANTFNGVVIKYSEPPEARRPKRRWRLYPFKGETSLPILHIHRQSAYLMGRDRKVADIPIDHPSCSKQHAALQYRLVPFTRADGSSGRQIKLYVIDLESANGTFLNNNKIEPKKYYELKERDVIKFGFSSRDYVLLHEHSKDSENDDDVNDE